jgi:hypothetical protein
MSSAWLLLAGLTVTVFITASLLAALASFDAQVLPEAAHRQLTASARTAIVVSGPVDADVARADAAPVRAALHGIFGAIPYQADSALWSNPLGLATQGSGPVQLFQAAAPGDFRSHAALTAGHWPGAPSPGAPIPAAVPAIAAARLHLRPGQVVTARDRDTKATARLAIAGVYRIRDPAAGYWTMDLVSTSGASTQPGFITFGPVIVAPAAFGTKGLAVGQASWLALADPARVPVGGMTALTSRIGAATRYLQGSVRLGGLQVNSGLPALLTSLSREVAVARSMLVISALQLLLLAAAALALASRLLTGHRAGETALMSSRGAAGWQLAGLSVPEIGLLAALAAAAGALAGSWLARLLARTGPLAGAGLHPTGLPASAWVVVGGAAVLAVLITAAPALRPATPGAVRARHGRQAALAGIARSGADVGLIVVALIAVRELRSYSAVAHNPSGGLGIDPVLAAAPALALAAVSLVLLRLLPLAARGLERLIARGRHLSAALASWEISRRAVTQSGPVLLAVLAVATGTLSLAQYQSWHQSARDQAAFTAGADVRVTPAGPTPLSRSGLIAGLPGVTAAMPVARTTLSLTGSSVLALDAWQAAGTVLLRRDLSPVPRAALWRRITPAGRAPGLVLPGRPARAQIMASIRLAPGAPGLGQVAVTADIQDATGATYVVAAGPLRADGHSHALVIPLSASRQAAYPLRLTGLSLSWTEPVRPATARARVAARNPAKITFSSLALSGAASGPFAAPFARGDALADWSPSASASALSSLGPPNIVGDALPGVITGAPTPGGVTQVGLVDGYSPGPRALRNLEVAGVGSVFYGTLQLTPSFPAGPLPAIATSRFLAANHARLGSHLALDVRNTTVRVAIVAVIKAFPTAVGGLIVDQRALADAMTGAGGAPLPAAQFWLTTAGGAVPRGLPAGSSVTSRNVLQARLLANPLSVAPLVEALAIAAAAALLAALGFSIGVAASVRSRRAQSALLSALGHSRAAQARGLCLEELMLTVPAALAGLGAGIGLAQLLVPAMTLTPAATVPLPPVLVEAPLGWILLLTAAVAVAPVLVAAVVVAQRPDPAAQLRAAEAT